MKTKRYCANGKVSHDKKKDLKGLLSLLWVQAARMIDFKIQSCATITKLIRIKILMTFSEWGNVKQAKNKQKTDHCDFLLLALVTANYNNGLHVELRSGSFVWLPPPSPSKEKTATLKAKINKRVSCVIKTHELLLSQLYFFEKVFSY